MALQGIPGLFDFQRNIVMNPVCIPPFNRVYKFTTYQHAEVEMVAACKTG